MNPLVLGFSFRGIFLITVSILLPIIDLYRFLYLLNSVLVSNMCLDSFSFLLSFLQFIGVQVLKMLPNYSLDFSNISCSVHYFNPNFINLCHFSFFLINFCLAILLILSKKQLFASLILCIILLLTISFISTLSFINY
jgi:hypothetical protein